MQITDLIAQNILQVFEGDNWTDVCIADTLKDIPFDKALQQTNGSTNTIASLTHHLLYWNEVVMKRMNGEAPEIPATNGFDVPSLKNDNDWKQLIEATHQSFIQLSKAVQNFPEEKLLEITNKGKSSYYKTMQGITEHAHYHLGQMIIIKHLLQVPK